MPQYKVVAPCSVVRAGRAWRVGDVVEVDESRAKHLVAAGKLEPLGIPWPTRTVLDGIKRTERSLDGDAFGDAVAELDRPEDSEGE